jgi:hypothetical protein
MISPKKGLDGLQRARNPIAPGARLKISPASEAALVATTIHGEEAARRGRPPDKQSPDQALRTRNLQS